MNVHLLDTEDSLAAHLFGPASSFIDLVPIHGEFLAIVAVGVSTELTAFFEDASASL